MASKKSSYSEPKDFIPKEIRKKYGLGEYASNSTTKKTVKKTKRK